MSRLYSMEMELLPNNILDLKYQEYLTKYNIICEPSDAPYDGRVQVRVKFPTGWTSKSGDGSTLDYLEFFDSAGIPRFYIRAKLQSYDFYVSIHFYSDEESESKDKENKIHLVKEQEANDFLETNFTQEWSETNNTIVYWCFSGYERACSYFAGYPHDQQFEDGVMEFSRHKLVGFCRHNDTEINIEKYRQIKPHNDGNQLLSQQLDLGMKNLHRFEISHMFGYDPNLTSGKNSMYDSSLHQQVKSKFKIKKW